MGTVFEQPERRSFKINADQAIDFINMIEEIQNESFLDFNQVVKVLELMIRDRANNLYLANGNIHDEQISGLATILKEIDESICMLANNVSSISASVFFENALDINKNDD